MISNKLKLRVRWNSKEQNFMIFYPRKSDGHFIHSALLSKKLVSLFTSDMDNKEDKDIYEHHDRAHWNENISYYHWDWIKELDRRGFDLKTLKFEITIKREALAEEFSHIWEILTEKEKAEAISMGFEAPKES